MSNQLARLFLRGSLMNETAKLLSHEEISQVEDLMMEAWNDPAIQSQKMEFYMALGRTIGNEYKNIEVGKQDALITFWKASLLVLFHESKQCTNKSCRRHFVTTKSKINTCTKCGGELATKWSPKPQIARDPIKRKKFFQAVMFNYLRQIFRENKPPSMKEVRTEEGLAPDVTLSIVTTALKKFKEIPYEVETVENGHYTVHCETGLLPLKAIKHLAEVKSDLEQHGVQIQLGWTKIDILSVMEIPPTISCKIVEKVYARFTSFDSGSSNEDSDGGFRDACEHKVVPKVDLKLDDKFEYSETIDTIRNRLPDDAKRLLDLILNTPQDYIDRFGTDKLYNSHLAIYFGKPVNEIIDLKENIKIHCLAMNLGID